MPLFGKPQLGQPRKPFDLSQQNGEQVDAVRSKIASLMDGVTEKRAAPHGDAPTETDRLLPAAIVSAPDQEAYGTSVGTEASTPLPADDDGRSNSERWSTPGREPETRTLPLSNAPVEQTQTSQWNGSVRPRFNNSTLDNREPEQWPRRSGSQQEVRRQEEAAPKATSMPAAAPAEQQPWPLPPTMPAPQRPATYADHAAVDSMTLPTSRPIVPDPEGALSATTAAAPEQVRTKPSTSREYPPVANAINIKGRAGGILVEIGKGHWPDLMTALAERLAGAGNFFRNGAVALDLADRPLTEPELRRVHTMLTEQALELVLVRTASPDTFQVALDMGLAAQLETLEGETTASAQPALSNLADEHHFVYAGHLRAGQVLQRREHVLIIGDVNPGATVISDGDILVWGHLRGMAQAGASGDARAVVAALNLIPVQLRIGDFIAIAPEQKNKRNWGRQRLPAKQPEVAYLNGDRIIVEPWDASKFGGIAALRQ